MAKMINYEQLKERMTVTQEKGQPGQSLTDLNRIQNMVSYLYTQNVFRGKDLETFSIDSKPENIKDLLKVCNVKSQSIKNGLETMVQKQMGEFSDLFKNRPAVEKLECLDYVALITRGNIEAKVLESIPQRNVSLSLYNSSPLLKGNKERMDELSKELHSIEKLGTTPEDQKRKQELFKELAALKFNSYDSVFQDKDKLKNTVVLITEGIMKDANVRKDFLDCVKESYPQKNLFIDKETGELNEQKYNDFVKKAVINKLVAEYSKSFYNKQVEDLGFKNAIEDKALNKSLHDKLKEVHGEELGFDLFRILAVSLKHYATNYAKANNLDNMKVANQEQLNKIVRNIPKEYLPELVQSAMNAGVKREMLQKAGVEPKMLDKASKNIIHKADVKEAGKEVVATQGKTVVSQEAKTATKAKTKSKGQGLEM